MRIGREGADLTARARIRDAAIARFAERGYAGTSIRDVAAAAQVSPGLVQHHFGSKEELRAACDEYVTGVLHELTVRKLEATEYSRDLVSSLFDASRGIIHYIARGLVEGWPGMAGIFDQVAQDSGDWLRRTWPERYPSGSADARTHASMLAALSFSVLVLHPHLARWWDGDPLSREQERTRSTAMMEVISRLAEFMDSAQGRSMRSALAEYERESEARPQESDASRSESDG